MLDCPPSTSSLAPTTACASKPDSTPQSSTSAYGLPTPPTSPCSLKRLLPAEDNTPPEEAPLKIKIFLSDCELSPVESDDDWPSPPTPVSCDQWESEGDECPTLSKAAAVGLGLDLNFVEVEVGDVYTARDLAMWPEDDEGSLP